MSNLYKQQFVIAQDEVKRVINSNAMVAERLEMAAREMKSGFVPGEDGFTEGILAEEVSVADEEKIDYVEAAKMEAEQILAEAKMKADSLLNGAYEQSGKVLEEAKEQGYQEGKQRQQEELEQFQKELEQEYQDKKAELDADYQNKFNHMERDLVDVILDVFNKVFHIQFDNKKHILMYLINNAVLNIEGEKKFRVRVARGNLLFLENHKEEMLDRVGHDVELEIIADSTMDGNDCVIETESGVFECSLGVQLENLIKDIRSLCS
ncbi:MAG: FliH/SctL family protein [Roseburia sp.]